MDAFYCRFLWLVSDSRGSFLLQTIIECSSDEIYTELYSSVCKGHLLNLAVHPQANFVLESLITKAKDKQQVYSLGLYSGFSINVGIPWTNKLSRWVW